MQNRSLVHLGNGSQDDELTQLGSAHQSLACSSPWNSGQHQSTVLPAFMPTSGCHLFMTPLAFSSEQCSGLHVGIFSCCTSLHTLSTVLQRAARDCYCAMVSWVQACMRSALYIVSGPYRNPQVNSNNQCYAVGQVLGARALPMHGIYSACKAVHPVLCHMQAMP